MDASSRAPAPPPLDLGPVRAATSPVAGTPQSAGSMTSGPFSGSGYYYASPTSTTSTSSPLLWGTSTSTSSRVSPATAADSMTRPAVISSKKVNANSYCGRHSDEFLFGGKGLGDLWRAVTKK